MTPEARTTTTRRIVGGTIVIAVVAVAAIVTATRLRQWRTDTDDAVEDIEARLAGLDPVTRASVIARLSSNGVKQVRSSFGPH